MNDINESCSLCEQDANVKVGDDWLCFSCFAGSHGGTFKQEGNTMTFTGLTVEKNVQFGKDKS